MMTRPPKAHYTLLTLFIMLALALAGCRHDERLDRASTLIGSSPEKALDSLLSIDSLQLSTADRRMREFLIVKAMDKGYVTHTSDSIIRPALDYFKGHGPRELRAEVAYYGGRVYSDLGDYPSAINYYHDAIDLLPDDTDSLRLKASILSQTGRLLNTIRLYDKASECIGQAIEINTEMNDSVKLMYNLQLLGVINFHKKDFNTAEPLLLQSKRIAEKVSRVFLADIDLYLAPLALEKGYQNHACEIIRKVPEEIGEPSKPAALAYAASIFYKAEVYDTAYIFAHRLISLPKSRNTINGYEVMLKPELRKYIPSDSLYIYFINYRDLVEEKLERNGEEQTLMQASYYNYQSHDRAREAAETKTYNLRFLIVILLFIVVTLSFVLLYIRYRNRVNLLKLHRALETVEELRRGIDSNTSEEDNDNTDNQTVALKDTIVDNIMSKVQTHQNYEVPETILDSDAYTSLRAHISGERIIKDDDPLWQELEKAVLATSRDFKKLLITLNRGAIDTLDYHLTLLIKCGISPTQMTFLVNRTKGTLSTRRGRLCHRMFGKKLGVKFFDDVIRSL